MALKFTVAVRNALMDNLAASIGANGLVRIYNGTRPATAATALSGNTLLAEMPLGNPIAPAAANGVLTVTTPIQDASADNTGTATWFRIFKSDGTTPVTDGDVGISGTDMILNTVSIVAGGPVQITAFTITAPGA